MSLNLFLDYHNQILKAGLYTHQEWLNQAGGHRETVRVTEDYLFSLSRRGQSALECALIGRMGPEGADAIHRVGSDIAHLLKRTTEQLRVRSAEHDTLTIRLFCRAVVGVPWEILLVHRSPTADPGQDRLLGEVFMSGRDVAPLLEDGLASIPPSPGRDKLHVLYLFDRLIDPNPHQELCDRLTRLGVRPCVAPAKSLDTLRERLEQYDIVHYSGEAEAGEAEGGCRFGSERLTLEAVRSWDVQRWPAMFVIAACPAVRAELKNGQWLLDEFPQEFLRRGVRFVVTPLARIPEDFPARSFLVALCDKLQAGCTVGHALRSARSKLSDEGRDLRGRMLGASVVLYGCPSEYLLEDIRPSIPAPLGREKALEWLRDRVKDLEPHWSDGLISQVVDDLTTREGEIEKRRLERVSEALEWQGIHDLAGYFLKIPMHGPESAHLDALVARTCPSVFLFRRWHQARWSRNLRRLLAVLTRSTGTREEPLSPEEIAERAGLSVGFVKDAISRLEAEKVIVSVRTSSVH
jgi:CHAT domain-containing protein